MPTINKYYTREDMGGIAHGSSRSGQDHPIYVPGGPAVLGLLWQSGGLTSSCKSSNAPIIGPKMSNYQSPNQMVRSLKF